LKNEALHTETSC